MDLVQIGKFIAQLRKEHEFSQEKLGEILGVTNKTISRWETGTYLPPSEMLLSMSNLFCVTIDELLDGKRRTQDDYKVAAEENLRQGVNVSSFTLQEKVAFFKKKWLKEHIAAMSCWGIGIIAVLVVSIIFRLPILAAAAMLLLLLGHAWRNNTMMAYVERNAFDGTGRND
ncbi:MAG: helix-turn-helix transcriptional regulator [Ruminococcaceae bacterium]|nr:helix-turn-helix transcriptional regulator [Oscillospiraceae bacterium]